jgi:hypothetical protein
VNAVKRWFTEFQRLYWQVAVSVHETKTVRRLVNELERIRVASIETHDFRMHRVFTMFAWAWRALEADPRELAGQVLGRFPVKAAIREEHRETIPAEEFTFCQAFRAEAERWVESARNQGKLKVAVPASLQCSGLTLTGGKLRRIVPFSAHVLSIVFLPGANRCAVVLGDSNPSDQILICNTTTWKVEHVVEKDYWASNEAEDVVETNGASDEMEHASETNGASDETGDVVDMGDVVETNGASDEMGHASDTNGSSDETVAPSEKKRRVVGFSSIAADGAFLVAGQGDVSVLCAR